MTSTTINTRTTPTAEAIQEALTLLRTFSEKKPASEDGGKTEWDSFLNSDIFKTIEAALKICAEAKGKADSGEDDSAGGENTVRGKSHAARTADLDDEEEDADDDDEEDDADDDEEEDDNPFAGDYYWCPGPEWKAIGLVAGGAALVGLGALLYKLFDD